MIEITIVLMFIGLGGIIIGYLEEDNKPFIFGGFFFLIGILSFFYLNNNKKIKQTSIKIDLPEEIYEACKGDTLYINKRTKDSIYLGFKPLKE